jgi:uncharacterized repeat protein (TIGR03803 family)
MDLSGNLYGTTSGYSGAVFALTPDANRQTWQFSQLHDFCAEPRCADGFYPNGNLIVDAAGNLYGTTSAGGAHGGGTAFELSPDQTRTVWTLKTLFDFCHRKYSTCLAPSNPTSGLTYAGAATGAPYDGVSPLYGTTQFGGIDDQGTVFQLTPADGEWQMKVVHKFCLRAGCNDGGSPLADLLVDAASNIYGTTYVGGGGHSGTVFKLSPNGRQTKWNETLLYDFCLASGCRDGASPLAAVTMDAAGELFGTTVAGGHGKHCDDGNWSPCGVAFKLVPNGGTSQESVLHNFCSLSSCADGNQPIGDLTLDAAGDLLGATTFGGGNRIDRNHWGGGVVFSLKGKLSVLYAFCAQAGCSDGEYPSAGMIADPSGNLFGTTSQGGAGAYRDDHIGGTVFELTP